MGTQQARHDKSRTKVSLLALFICVFCLLGVLGLVGCTTSTGDNGSGNSTDSGNVAMNSEQVSGSITEIIDSELLVEITTSTAPGLSQGLVRVDTGQIDSSIVKSLKVGDKITFEFTGQMGMSEPPFVSATSLEVNK